MRLLRRITLLPLLVGVYSCVNPEINVDPNKSTNMTHENVMAYAILHGVGDDYDIWRGNLIYGEQFIQHLSSTSKSWAGNYYTYNEEYMSAFWERIYRECTNNLEIISSELKGDGVDKNANKLAVIQVLQVWNYHRLADFYGPIPYSEAGKAETEQNFTPRYDDVKDIYLGNEAKGIVGLLTQLEQAQKVLSNPGTDETFIEGDLFFNGELSRWNLFCNSLMLRLALRVSDKAPDVARKYIQKAFDGGVILENSDNVFLNHTTDNSRYMNPVARVFFNYGGVSGHLFRYSDTFINTLKNYTDEVDPRLAFLAGVYNPDEKYFEDTQNYYGLPNGLETNEMTDLSEELDFDDKFEEGIGVYGFAQPHRKNLVHYTAPTIVFHAAETKFLLAEAVLKGLLSNGKDANTYYREGIKKGMELMEDYNPEAAISNSMIDNYLSHVPDLGTNSSMGLEGSLDEIQTQKWISLLLNGYESYAEWRRTHYPSIVTKNQVKHPDNRSNGKIPGRVMYPSREQGTNAKGYQSGIQYLESGENDFVSDLWWAKDHH
ncbi:SusD/RagB family nutrient-binding outer membrane lipoprotein [Flammeovirga yaeyamensis]|uniref:SusD/RagB family nutrient-binding outer membrane lipoprotein n=1 Tax=Flammeovirga yaeyamensis TaxID=367791 RepID=A0AAX1N3C1_9BACT|nr:SusD/RagB family nutrient-binding outer membrane lipoprotein [Flammeovirga yaeyamensis]MBB3700625.1 hypothetical protein [Flammeovirga yaeyamensis]NMF37741.1 SusD/RagB family nutrient-binding outer membrane lipoprotein [Flammeovirga yaeyamensis]QWG02050.1 SusD/RagB family nutrient-binding outer membrane lipoprotein [Flammeovirga yaeyamensis]